MDDWKVISEYTELATALNPERFRRGSRFGKTVKAAPAAAEPPKEPSAEEQEAASEKAEAEKAKADAAKRRSRALTESRSFFVKNSKAPPAKNDMMKLSTLSQSKYADQAQWFLNAYWKADEITFSEHPDECEHVWTWAANMTKLDKALGEQGAALEEFEAHIFLEKNVKAITVTKMRKVLRDIDIDFDGKVSLTEALIYFYKIDYHYLVNAVVGDDESKELLEAAQAALDAATRALREAKAAKEAADAAEAAAAQAAEDSAAAAVAAKEAAALAATKEQEAKDAEAAAEEKHTAVGGPNISRS